MEPCLLVHGLTASPGQLVSQKESLQEAGYPVSLPLLSGHGTVIEDLFPLRWQDWYADVLRALDQIRERHPGQRIHYIGLSWGAMLGLQLALDRPDQLRSLVCMATPLVPYRWMQCLYPLLRWTPLRWCLNRWPKNFDLAVADPEGREVYRRCSYDAFPLVSYHEVRHLQRLITPALSQITTPLLVIHAREDHTAPPRGAQLLFDRVAGPKQLRWCEHSYHVLSLDYEREQVNRWILEFLESFS